MAEPYSFRVPELTRAELDTLNVLRLERGLTWTALSKAVGISEVTLKRIARDGDRDGAFESTRFHIRRFLEREGVSTSGRS